MYLGSENARETAGDNLHGDPPELAAFCFWWQPPPHPHKVQAQREAESKESPGRPGRGEQEASPAMVARPCLGCRAGAFLLLREAPENPLAQKIYFSVASLPPCYSLKGHEKVTFILQARCCAVSATRLHSRFECSRKLSLKRPQ